MHLVSKVALNLFWIAAAAFILAASAASAQTYPPGTETLTADVDDDTPDPGSSVNVAATVKDGDGNVIADETVTFTITSNPGDASFANGQQTTTAQTDANGSAIVVLNTGATPGTIVIRVDHGSSVSQVTVVTGAPQALPKTGGDPGSGGTDVPLTAVLVASTAFILLAAGATAARKLRLIGS